jgi:hypothetical protein
LCPLTAPQDGKGRGVDLEQGFAQRKPSRPCSRSEDIVNICPFFNNLWVRISGLINWIV